MASAKSVILVRVQRDLYEKIQARAQSDSRSLSSTVELVLKKAFGTPRRPITQRGGA